MPVIVETNLRGQGHEDGFGASAGLQPEQGAAVVHQVELDVAAAPVQLESALAFTVGMILAP